MPAQEPAHLGTCLHLRNSAPDHRLPAFAGSGGRRTGKESDLAKPAMHLLVLMLVLRPDLMSSLAGPGRGAVGRRTGAQNAQ